MKLASLDMALIFFALIRELLVIDTEPCGVKQLVGAIRMEQFCIDGEQIPRLELSEAKSAALTAFAPTKEIQTSKNKLKPNALIPFLSIPKTPFVRLPFNSQFWSITNIMAL